MGANQQLLAAGGGAIVTGQQAYTTAGTYSWVAPAGVTKVSVVAVGPGNYAGGGLGYKNNTSVTPGSSYTVVVGAGNSGTNSYFSSACLVRGGAACSAYLGPAGTYIGDGGGNGGGPGLLAGGGAGGYSGNGGTYTWDNASGGNGAGGGGGSGVTAYYCAPPCSTYQSSGGGGVGILGLGANGTGGSGGGVVYPVWGTNTVFGGTGGSGGGNGTDGTVCYFLFCCCWWLPAGTAGSGGNYGGGRGTGTGSGGSGAGGAVRIIWPGCARSFPSTRTADE